MKTLKLAIIFLAVILPLCGQTSGDNLLSTGPLNGTLIIIGGGEIDAALNQKIIETSGGLDIPIVVIPTADGRDNYDQDFGEAGLLRKMGATNVTV
nr:hypothetical protein [Bacteroidales bacterium]